MRPLFLPLILAGVGFGSAAVSQTPSDAGRAYSGEMSERTWSLTVWPNAALLADKTLMDLDYDLTRSLTCIKGRPELSLRSYHYGPRPPNARKGCDTQCRTERVATEADGRRPNGFSEQTLDWPQAMRVLAAEGWIPGKPFRRKLVKPGDLEVEEGEIDQNIDGVPDETDKPRKVQDLEGSMAELAPRFAAACRFKLPRLPATAPRRSGAPFAER